MKSTVIHVCHECRVLTISTAPRERCTLCDGVMATGTPPQGTYAPLTEAARHAAFARMAAGNQGLRP